MKKDQHEILAEIAKLRLKSANLRAQLAGKGIKMEEPNPSADSISTHEIYTNHVADLESRLEGKTTKGTSWNLTEQVLRARGVASLAELETSFKPNIHD